MKPYNETLKIAIAVNLSIVLMALFVQPFITDLYKWQDLISMLPVFGVLIPVNLIYWKGRTELVYNIALMMLNWFALINLYDAFYCHSVYAQFDTYTQANEYLNKNYGLINWTYYTALFSVCNVLACIAWHVWSRKKMG